MARKKRQAETLPIPAQPGNEKKTIYRDDFQQTIDRKIENVGSKFEGKGKNILYGLAAIAVLASLIGIFYVWNRRSNAQAQTALGKAIETSTAQVTESPLPAVSTAKTFRTEQQRAEASISEFQAVADKFGGDVGDKARYFVAVNKLQIDRAAAMTDLQALVGKSGEVGNLSKFALAQAKNDAGDLDGAAALYQELAGASNSVIAKDTVKFQLAKIYEKQGKRAEAADLYFEIAKAASEAKDLEDKPVPLTQTAREAKEKLAELNPEKAKEIKEPEIAAPTSGMPFGG